MKLRIKELREDRDTTQMQVSMFLHCDQSLYSKYEREERAIPVDFLFQLADFYGTSVDYLLCRTDNPVPYPASEYLSAKKPRQGKSREPNL